jgi:hypothetical protein
MAWGVVYYRAPNGSIPAEEFLDSCPTKVEATILAVLEAVRRAPPPQFSGGGKWEAMHGEMGGYYEICQRPSVSPQGRPSVLPSGGHVFSPLVAIGSPRLG